MLTGTAMRRPFFEFGGTGAVVIGVAALLFASLALPIEADRRALDRRGHAVEATVTRLWLRDPTSGHAPRNHMAAFEFETGTGEVVRIRRHLPRDLYADLVEGGPLPVRYLPEDPDTYRIEGLSGQRSARQFRLSALSLGGLALGFAGFAWVRAKWAADARVRGLVARATITRHLWPIGRDAAGTGPAYARIEWTFRDADGVMRTGRSSPFNFYPTEDHPLGALVEVHYLPETPERSFWGVEI